MVSFVSAQDKGQFGINMKVDPSPQLGFTYHLSQKFALRPFFGFSQSSTTSDREFKPENRNLPAIIREHEDDSTAVNLGMGLLYYFYTGRDISVYTGVNFGYIRTTREHSIKEVNENWENTGNTLRSSLIFGLQCMLKKNLGIFGEFGFGYSTTKFSHENGLELDNEATQWGLMNTGIGLIFYF